MALELRERACERRVDPHLISFRGAEVPNRVVAVALVEDENIRASAAVEIVEPRKTQATGTEKLDATLRGMRWKRNVPALQPSYFNAQPALLERRRSAPADVRRDAAS